MWWSTLLMTLAVAAAVAASPSDASAEERGEEQVASSNSSSQWLDHTTALLRHTARSRADKKQRRERQRVAHPHSPLEVAPHATDHAKMANRTRRDSPCSNAGTTDDVEYSDPHVFGNAATLLLEWVDAATPHVLALEVDTTTTTKNFKYSPDGGKTYNDTVSDKISDFAISDTKLPAGTYAVFAVPEDTRANYFYWSGSSGDSFTKFESPVHFDAVKIHPVDPNLVLGITYAYEKSWVVEVSTVHLLRMSGNANDKPSVIKLLDYVFFVEWLAPQDETQDFVTTILLTRFEKAPVQEVEALSGLDFVRWEEPFGPQQAIVARKQCYVFEQQSEFIFVTELPKQDDPFNERALWVSTNEGYNWNKAQFPVDARENHYKVVDATEGMAMVVLQHTVTTNEGVFNIKIYDSTKKLNKQFDAWRDTWSQPVNENGLEGLSLYYDSGHDDGCSMKGLQSQSLTGKVVVFRRGECTFSQKILHAEMMGAVGVIIVNTEDSALRMAPPKDFDSILPSIPGFLVRKSDGEQIIKFIDQYFPKIYANLVEDEVRERELWSGTNLYTSRSEGYSFSLSLKDVEYLAPSAVSGEVVDVFKVDCQPGTYFANYIDAENNFVTVVTFNKGASWRRIPKPEGAKCPHDDLNDKGNTMDVDHCTLHLGLESSNQLNGLPTPKIAPQASCVVVANGYLGTSVSPWAEDASVVVSEDGGLTWRLASELNGPHNFRLLDHGSLIVAAPMFTATDSIMYSLDRGLSWEKKAVLKGTHPISGLVTEPTGSALFAFVYYKDYSQDTPKWIGVAVDFANLRLCTSADEDIYYGSDGLVHDEATEGRCLLGASRAFQRIKLCSICTLPNDFDSGGEAKEHCSCTASDLVCNPGFYRANPTAAPDSKEGACVRDPEYTLPHCQGTDTHATVQIYSKVEGDLCSETSEIQKKYLDPRPARCQRMTYRHSSQVSASGGIAIAIAIVVILVGACAIVLYFSSRSRARLISLLGVEDGLSGRCGRCFAGCKWFRGGRTYQYSNLYEQAQEWSDDDEEGLEDDDDLLFGIEDAQPHDDSSEA